MTAPTGSDKPLSTGVAQGVCPQMQTRKATVATCHDADGIVVVIDVLRAFTTAAYAFHQGVTEIFLVATVAEAFDLKRRNPECLLLGEVDGLPIDGFELANSPSALASLDLSSKRLIQRTSAGTQGVVCAVRANRLFAASLCVASATARCIATSQPESVTFVETGVRAKGGGDDDIACADFISSLLCGTPLISADIQDRVLNSQAAAKFSNPGNSDFPSADLDYALKIDRFDFAMEVERTAGLQILRASH